MPAHLASRITRPVRSILTITLLSAVLTGAFAGFTSTPASALTSDTTIGCSLSQDVSVSLARLPVTASGQQGWSYSVFFVGDYRNPWVSSNWVAAYANAGAAPSYELLNGLWSNPGPSIEIDVPPHYGTSYVWQQKWEVVNGQWSTEWVYLGNCTPPPGF